MEYHIYDKLAIKYVKGGVCDLAQLNFTWRKDYIKLKKTKKWLSFEFIYFLLQIVIILKYILYILL